MTASGNMLFPSLRARLCALGFLFSIYLAGVLLLSTVSLDSDRGQGRRHGGDFGKAERSTQTMNVGHGSSQHGLDLAAGIRAGARRTRLHWCHMLRFMQEPGPVVALASFPGSGNTWLRYLLQQATGVYTGSVYKDYGLLKNGFPAESVVNGSVMVVKTHEWGPPARRPFHKTILLVRPPGPAIQAEFNRQSGGHIGFASPDRYRRNKGKYWQDFVNEKLSNWKSTNLDWLYNFTGPKHVVFYEELVNEVERELRAILAFLSYNITESAMSCVMDRREGIYKRKRRVLTFDPYTSAMRESLNREQDLVFSAIRTYLESRPVQNETLEGR